MLKQTKTAFSKSLGSLKYVADYVGYDTVEIASSIVENLDVEDYTDKEQPTSIIIFGNKRKIHK
jgi:hypothetical protein